MNTSKVMDYGEDDLERSTLLNKSINSNVSQDQRKPKSRRDVARENYARLMQGKETTSTPE
jgi:hypothetical protein